MTRKMLMAALLMAAFSQGTQAQDLSGQRSESYTTSPECGCC